MMYICWKIKSVMALLPGSNAANAIPSMADQICQYVTVNYT